MATVIPLANIERELLADLLLAGGGSGPLTIGRGLASAGDAVAATLLDQRRQTEARRGADALFSLGRDPAAPTQLPGAAITAGGDLPAALPAAMPAPTAFGGLTRDQFADLLEGAPGALEYLVARRFPEPIGAAEQARLDLQRQELGLRRDQFASEQEFRRAKLALDERKLAADQAGLGRAKLSDIGSFRGQYTGLSEDFIALRDAYGKLRAAVSDPSAAGDVALISGYMKILDPTSVVREGEYATAANAAGVPEQVRGYWNRLVNGERLTAEQRTDFARQAHGLFAAQLAQQEQLQGAYRGIASRTMPNVDPADAVPDFIGTAREWAPIVGEPSQAEQAASRAVEAITPEAARGLTFDQLLDRFAPNG